MLKYLILDVHGVLLSTGAINRAFAEVMTKTGIAENDILEFYRKNQGTPLRQQMQMLLRDRGKIFCASDVERLAKICEEILDKQSAELMPGAIDALKKLYNDGWIMLVSSGERTKALAKIFEQLDIKKYFKIILGSETLPKSRAHIEYFAKELGQPVESFCRQTVSVGDGLNEMQIARECSIYAIGIVIGMTEEELRQAGANAVINSIAGLPELLEELAKDKATRK